MDDFYLLALEALKQPCVRTTWRHPNICFEKNADFGGMPNSAPESIA